MCKGFKRSPVVMPPAFRQGRVASKFAPAIV
jgi:hypothetical protein